MSGWVDGQGEGRRNARQLGTKPVITTKHLMLNENKTRVRDLQFWHLRQVPTRCSQIHAGTVGAGKDKIKTLCLGF